jgi:hypothetical protein
MVTLLSGLDEQQGKDDNPNNDRIVMADTIRRHNLVVGSLQNVMTIEWLLNVAVRWEGRTCYFPDQNGAD